MHPILFDDLGEDRYDRQRLIPWWDQDRLRQAHVIVAGAGALGNEVLKLLALLGFGQVTVVDFDVISPSNLARMVLFRPEDVGRLKVEVAAERLQAINPDLRVRPIAGDLRFDLGLGDYRRADLVFGCLDSVSARWALNRKCRLAGVPWINGGISDYHGQVTYFDPQAGACYECTFTEDTYARLNRRYSCPYGLIVEQAEQAVPTTAVTTSIVAALQVQEALYHLHSQQAGLQPGERLSIYLRPYRLFTDLLPANPACLAHEHLPAEVPILAGASLQSTVAAALALAQAQIPAVQILSLPYDLVVAFSCPNCGRQSPVLRPRPRVFQAEATCPNCHSLRTPEMVDRIEADSPLAKYTLAELGLPAHEILNFNGTAGTNVVFELE